MKKKGKIAFLVLSVLVLGVFLSWKFVFKPNTRWFFKDGIKAWADLNIERNDNYFIVEIGDPNRSFDSLNIDVSFMIDEKTILHTNGISIQEIKQKSERIVDANKFQKEWPEGSQKIYMDGYLIIMKGNTIHYFRATADKNDVGDKKFPAIGLHDKTELFKLPLNQSQLTTIFGEPEDIKDFFKL